MFCAMERTSSRQAQRGTGDARRIAKLGRAFREKQHVKAGNIFCLAFFNGLFKKKWVVHDRVPVTKTNHELCSKT